MAIVNIVTFLLVGIVLNIAQVLCYIFILLYHFNGVNLSAGIISSTTFLVAFVSFGSLSLGLTLRLTCINRKGTVARLSFIIPIVPTRFVLLGGPVALWAPGIDLSYF